MSTLSNLSLSGGLLIPNVGGGAGGLADTALTYLDFTSAEYYVEGSPITLDQVFVDPVTPTPGVGLEGTSAVATGVLAAALAGEQTVIIDAITTFNNTQMIQWDGANDVQLYRQGGQANLYYGGANDIYSGTWVSGEPTRIAFLIGASECAISCNGATVAVGAGSTLNFGTVILLSQWTMQRLIVVDPVTSADLAALSTP